MDRKDKRYDAHFVYLEGELEGELVLNVGAALQPEGFDIYDQIPPNLQHIDLSTEDELVLCRHCSQPFDLSLVTLEGMRDFRSI